MTTSAYVLPKSNQSNRSKVSRVKTIASVTAAVVLCLWAGMSLADAVDSGMGDLPRTADTTIPFKSEGPSFAAMLAKLLVGTIVGLALAFAAGYAIKRGFYPSRQLSKGKSRIAVSEAKRIAPRVTVLIVNVDGREHKLVQSGDHIIELRSEVKDDVGVRRDER